MSGRPAPADGRVVVVGGGPAGLAVAIHARLAGLPVTVLDRARPPIDKPCGEGLMPDGVARLEALGVELPPSARPFHGIRYLDERTVAEGRFPPDRSSRSSGSGPSGRTGSDGGRSGSGLGIRRTELHAAMVRRAEALGVELRWGERVERVIGDRGDPGAERAPERAPVGVVTAAGEEVLGAWLVGADGLRSRVRRHLNDPRTTEDERAAGDRAGAGRAAGRGRRPRRFGVRRHLRLAPWTDLVEVHWSHSGPRGGAAEAYVTPVGPETVGVAVLWSPDEQARGVGFDDLLTRFPRLAERVTGAPAISRGLDRDKGCGPLGERVPVVARGRVALVGDAGGSLDAITGEGLSLAFHQAEALVREIAACQRAGTVDLRGYARAHRRFRRLPQALIRLLLFVERRPVLRRRVLRALAAQPALFDRILGVHARTLRPRHLVAGGVLRFAGHLVRPPRAVPPPSSRPTVR